jgi:thioredoxin-like negative regulator of GroEL
LDEAESLSKTTRKPVLLILGADYCAYCHKLKDDLLNTDLKDSVDSYIVCYIDIEKHHDLKAKYSVSILPHSRITKIDGSVRSIEGYSKTLYQKWLKNDN